jgi:hypothetical protein
MMANGDESFNQEMKRQPGAACHVVSKQEGWNCTVGQQGYGILWIAHSLIFGQRWEPQVQLSLLICCKNCSVNLVKKHVLKQAYSFVQPYRST